jgi:hypothetical protein
MGDRRRSVRRPDGHPGSRRWPSWLRRSRTQERSAAGERGSTSSCVAPASETSSSPRRVQVVARTSRRDQSCARSSEAQQGSEPGASSCAGPLEVEPPEEQAVGAVYRRWHRPTDQSPARCSEWAATADSISVPRGSGRETVTMTARKRHHTPFRRAVRSAALLKVSARGGRSARRARPPRCGRTRRACGRWRRRASSRCCGRR